MTSATEIVRDTVVIPRKSPAETIDALNDRLKRYRWSAPSTFHASPAISSPPQVSVGGRKQWQPRDGVCTEMNILNEIFIGISELLESKAGLPDKVARFVPRHSESRGVGRGVRIGPSAPVWFRHRHPLRSLWQLFILEVGKKRVFLV
ncbi:hypothetical protein CDAR_11511 [Caerostris darwini]|uniref:Uncharacterized protein n=1 Tax=Caerostris darwini TaxID=1538125 RepID=A0AAV4RAY9_9ARAC|nr:hypothetical protein CDAR_11511 [Caerostris darwini]